MEFERYQSGFGNAGHGVMLLRLWCGNADYGHWLRHGFARSGLRLHDWRSEARSVETVKDSPLARRHRERLQANNRRGLDLIGGGGRQECFQCFGRRAVGMSGKLRRITGSGWGHRLQWHCTTGGACPLGRLTRGNQRLRSFGCGCGHGRRRLQWSGRYLQNGDPRQPDHGDIENRFERDIGNMRPDTGHHGLGRR
jgi:hypothetical protein